MAEYPIATIFSYGAILIERSELKELNLETNAGYVRSDRVSYTPRINTVFGTLAPLRMSMRLLLNPVKFKVWLDYYNALPINVSQTLTIGLDAYPFTILESIEADFTRYIFKDTVERLGQIDTKLEFVRGV